MSADIYTKADRFVGVDKTVKSYMRKMFYGSF